MFSKLGEGGGGVMRGTNKFDLLSVIWLVGEKIIEYGASSIISDKLFERGDRFVQVTDDFSFNGRVRVYSDRNLWFNGIWNLGYGW